MKKINFKRNSGYTIIETLISVSLFLVVVTYGITTLLNANLLRQKSADMRSIMDNLSFVMEDMSRNIRTGYTFYCITGSDNLSNVAQTKSGQNCWGIAFEPANGVFSNPNDQWVYYVGPDNSIPGNPLAVWKSTLGPYASSSFIKLTPDEVKIDAVTSSSYFSVLGAEGTPGDLQQPFVTIKLVGRVTFKNVVTPFSLQTSVSQRLIDS